jgi:hypothetical protein
MSGWSGEFRKRGLGVVQLDDGWVVAMSEWGANRRIDFPLDPPQHSCAFCGSVEWSWMLPLLAMSDERQAAEVFIPWFLCACAECGSYIDADDWDGLDRSIVRRLLPDDDRHLDREEFAAIASYRSGPALSRAECTSRHTPMLP